MVKVGGVSGTLTETYGLNGGRWVFSIAYISEQGGMGWVY